LGGRHFLILLMTITSSLLGGGMFFLRSRLELYSVCSSCGSKDISVNVPKILILLYAIEQIYGLLGEIDRFSTMRGVNEDMLYLLAVMHTEAKILSIENMPGRSPCEKIKLTSEPPHEFPEPGLNGEDSESVQLGSWHRDTGR